MRPTTPRGLTWHERSKVLLVLGLSRGCERSYCSAVERLFGGDDDRLSDVKLRVGVFPGKLKFRRGGGQWRMGKRGKRAIKQQDMMTEFDKGGRGNEKLRQKDAHEGVRCGTSRTRHRDGELVIMEKRARSP